MKTGAKMSVQAAMQLLWEKHLKKKMILGYSLCCFFELVSGNSVILLETFVMWSC